MKQTRLAHLFLLNTVNVGRFNQQRVLLITVNVVDDILGISL
ncbi:hypothetical protein [Pantoea endophytica]|nr:hypothetical protein [Pantoea endophytica]